MSNQNLRTLECKKSNYGLRRTDHTGMEKRALHAIQGQRLNKWQRCKRRSFSTFETLSSQGRNVTAKGDYAPGYSRRAGNMVQKGAFDASMRRLLKAGTSD